MYLCTRWAKPVLFLLLNIIFHNAYSEIKLPRLVSDGMVLQREKEIKIWGWAAPGEKVSVSFNGKTSATTTLNDGKWAIALPAMKAGGPYTMTLAGANQIEIKNILIGDVWVCSGQSNMALTMERVKEKYPDVISKADNPSIRHFFIATHYEFEKPQDELKSGKWEVANPQTVLNFSAVAYFFAKDLYERNKIPIGLINSSVGGSPVEAWVSEEVISKHPKYMSVLQQVKNPAYLDSIRKSEAAQQQEWYNKIYQNDEGSQKEKPRWFDENVDTKDWKSFELPGNFKERGITQGNGVVWFKKDITLPDSLAAKAAKLFLGRIIDADSVFVNGKFVGTISYQYPPRRYTIPEGFLRPGKNTITVRVITSSGNGAFITNKPYELVVGSQTIDLKGEWKYKIGTSAGNLIQTTFFQYKPAGLFNAMIAPLFNVNIAGVIWYQGESNTSSAGDYNELLSSLIKEWRQKWNSGEFPFLFVQLANLNKASDKPTESNWAELREAQLKTLTVENTAMAVIHDVGEWNDIHPLDKETVGKRLALAAQKLYYKDKKIVHSGPVYQSKEIKNDKVMITFKNTGGGLIAKDGKELKHFAIAGEDGKFVWANAKIDGDKIIVWSPDIKKPVHVRYAWADNPEGANLYNKEGLPASSFRTDK